MTSLQHSIPDQADQVWGGPFSCRQWVRKLWFLHLKYLHKLNLQLQNKYIKFTKIYTQFTHWWHVPIQNMYLKKGHSPSITTDTLIYYEWITKFQYIFNLKVFMGEGWRPSEGWGSLTLALWVTLMKAE